MYATIRMSIPLYGAFLLCSFAPTAVAAQAEALTRAAAVGLALEHNPQIKAARQSWEGARARARQDGALADPELQLEFEELARFGDLGAFGTRNIGIVQRLESPLKWWHRRRAGRQRAEAVWLGAVEMTQLDVRLRVLMAYERIALQQNILQHTRQNLDLSRDFLHKARIRFAAGDVPQLEVMRADVEAGRATNQVRLAENGLAGAQAEFNAVLARPLSTPVALVDSLIYQPLAADPDQLQEMAVQRRPDLSGAALSYKALRTRQAAATAAYLPDLHVGVSRQRLQEGARQDDLWRLSFAMEIPLWALSRQRAAGAEARAAAVQAGAERAVLEQQIRLETVRAYLDVTSVQQQVALFQRRILPEAERAFEVSSRSYDEGKATYLELLEAQRTLTATQIEYAQALFAHRAAAIQLEWAVAGPLPR